MKLESKKRQLKAEKRQVGKFSVDKLGKKQIIKK
jgi:hypothetical protein